MPTSKHRKKGQARAVKRPGKARVKKELAWEVQQRRLEDLAFEMVGADALADDVFDLMSYALELVLDEVLAFGVSGESLVPRIGSRQAVVEAFLAEFEGDDTVVGMDRAAIEGALARYASCGFLRFEEDQVFLAVDVPGWG